MKRLMPILLSLFTILLAGCTKKSDVPGSVLLLTNSEWKLTDIRVSPAIPLQAGNIVKNYSSLFEYYDDIQTPCYKLKGFNFTKGARDDEYRWGHYRYSYQNNCSTQPLLQEGTWNLQVCCNGLIQMFLYKDRENGVVNALYTVEEISGDRLIINNKASYSGSSTIYEFRYIYAPVQ